MKKRQNLVQESKYDVKCPYVMKAEYITVHNTANDATADNEIKYMISNDNEVSFHWAVDDIEAVQGIHTNRNAWACGDGGNGTGNRKSISVEICYSKSGGAKFDQAEKNAAILIAELMKEYGFGIDRIKKHQDWSNKYCPHRTLDNGWQRFLDMIQSEYDNDDVSIPSEPSSPLPEKPQVPEPTPQPTADTITLPKENASWRIYNENGPYTTNKAIGALNPQKFGGLTYDVVRWVTKGEVAIINTADFGRVAIYVASSTGAIIKYGVTEQKPQYAKEFAQTGQFSINTGKARYICDVPSLDSKDLGTVAPGVWTAYDYVVYNDGRIWCKTAKGWVSTGSYDKNTLKRTEVFADFK